MESSLRYHMQRRSILIKYKCHICHKSLKEYNRCSFLSHFRQHSESTVVQLDSHGIEISAIPAEEMNIGQLKLDDTLKATKKMVASVETQTSANDELLRCTECKSEIYTDIKTHFQMLSLNRNGQNLKCKVCELQFFSQCSLSAHVRYHKKQKPYVCPECGKVYSLWSSFIVHLNYTCFHSAKCNRYKCLRCTVFFKCAVVLEAHIVSQHVKNIYKCGGCELACFSEKSLKDHKRVAHSQQKLNTIRFCQCLLCNSLIQRDRLLHHVREHINKTESCTVGFQCCTCKGFYIKKSSFTSHKCYEKNKVLHMSQPDGVASKNKILYNCNINNNGCQEMKVMRKTFPFKRLTFPQLNSSLETQKCLKQYPAAKKLKSPLILNHHSDVSKQITTKSFNEDQNISKVVTSKSCVKIISNKKLSESYCSPNSVGLNKILRKCISCNCDFVTCTTSNKDLSECYRCATITNCGEQKSKNEYIAIRKMAQLKKANNKTIKELPGKILENLDSCKEINQRIAFITNSSDENGKFKCHLCKKLINLKDTKKHFSKEHKNFNLLTLSPMIEKIKINASDLSAMPNAVHNIQIKVKEEKIDFDSTLGNLENCAQGNSDTQEYSKKRKKIKLAHKEKMSTPVLPFSSGQLINPIESINDDTYSCSKCNFCCIDRKEFQSHIAIHRTDNSCFQCMECGMCFIVQPSFEKHLFVSHGIKEVCNYIESNINCKPFDGENNFADNSSSDEDLIQNECSVCHEVFDCTEELDKHFRVHGMAFLLKKQRELRKAIA